MELTLTRQSETQVTVACDNQSSHSFDLRPLLLKNEKDEKELFNDPIIYSKALYAALFPVGTLARRVLDDSPGRILLVTADNNLDAVPWEYTYGFYGSEISESFLVLECHFVRGLPADQRIAPPTLDADLHIVAVPSNPLSHELEPLNIDGEWMRLKDIIQELPYAITLERTRPPTLERLRHLVANQKHRIVHFMGHGGQDEKKGAILCFEQDNGDLDQVTAKDFMRRVHGTVFLVTLNACASATPGETPFSNLASALVWQKTPYALGMRFAIPDEDARSFSRIFYSDLARGTSVEEALRQARLTLTISPHRWVVGVPVLYTSLKTSASGFVHIKGSPIVKEHQPYIEVSALPRAEGTFQGRIEELKLLGEKLTGDGRPPLVTIHGGGGQGKTALAREAVERFAYAWPGGVWATSLESLPSREAFVNDLARFLGIATQKVIDPGEVERRLLNHLANHRVLIVLDNSETLIEAIDASNEAAVHLAQFIREQLPRPPVSLLITSRSYLGWSGEIGLELGGLAPKEGAELFRQNVPRLIDEKDLMLAWDLSQEVEGHPLSLRLLAGAFNASAISLMEFVKEYERHLLTAENKYKDAGHRHRSLYASIETSIHYLDTELCKLLSGLWVFHAPFSPDIAIAIFDPDSEGTGGQRSLIPERLQTLWHRGLLLLETGTISDELVGLYRLLPTVRHFIEQYLEQAFDPDVLLVRFGVEFAQLASSLHEDLNHSPAAVFIAQRLREDLDRGLQHVNDQGKAVYLLNWGWVLQRLGDTQRGLRLAEQALEIVQGENQDLEGRAFYTMAQIFYSIGQAQQALTLSEKSLSFIREMEDPENKANILDFMGLLYRDIGQPRQALALYEQVLPIRREVEDRESEAITLNNMALVYHDTGQLKQALALYEQALTIMREVGNLVEEANTLDNMANAYRIRGQLKEGLELSKQALSIRRAMGDRDGEAASLNSIALMYETLGQPQEALALHEQALLIRYELQDRGGEVTTHNNMMGSYLSMGQPKQVLQLAEQALPIARELGNRANEASVLNNMASAYRELGQLKQALALSEQVLPIMRELEDRRGVASTLSSMMKIYLLMGQPEQALMVCEQILPIMREVGDRRGEAITLNDMARVYDATGRLKQALALYEQALPIIREVGDRANESTMLQNMALLYLDIGEQQNALALAEQALLIVREVGNRAREATILSSVAGINRVIGRQQEALALYKQTLPIRREVGDRAGEAITLNNIGRLHLDNGHQEQALAWFEQSLSIAREVGIRGHEATTLNNMAMVYVDLGKPEQGLALLEQSLSIRREVGNRAGEATTLINMANVLYQYLNRSQEAITHMEQAIAVLIETNLSRDAAGRTVDELQQFLETMRQGVTHNMADGGSSALSAADIQQIITNTVAVMTVAQVKKTEWHKVIADALLKAQQGGAEWQNEVDFFIAVLDILDGRTPTLPADHSYTQTVVAIQEGIAAGGPQVAGVSDEVMQAVHDFINAKDWEATRKVVETQKSLLFRPEVEILFEQNIASVRASEEQDMVELLELHLALLRQCKKSSIAEAFAQLEEAQQREQALPFDAGLITRSVAALLDGPQEKMAYAQYLATQVAQTTDEELRALINAIQLALFGGELAQLGQNLSGVYRQAWETIVALVGTGGVDPGLVEQLIHNTLAVLGPAADRRNEWREQLMHIRNQATEGNAHELITLLDAIIELLDAEGTSTSLGADLTGVYAKTWQTIIERISSS